MKSLSQTRTRRKIAFAMLLVWLFAIASGLANACLLELPDAHFHGPQAGHTEPNQGAGPVGHGAASTDHDHELDHDSKSSKEPCLKVCDDGSRLVLKQKFGFDHHDPGPAPLVAVLWVIALPVRSNLVNRNDLWVPPDGLPFRVRYSR
ncbi:MAG: hypothetical protein IV107_20800, partial [Paucibacter sp.]|nr:hypothetical protein [Roseateles sp.]